MYFDFDRGFGEETFKIDAIDFLEFFKSEITFRASQSPKKEYIEVRWQ